MINLFQTNISYLSIEKVAKSYILSSLSPIAIDGCPMFRSDSVKIKHDQHVRKVENSSIIHIVSIECKQDIESNIQHNMLSCGQ